jgi:hypothetical protein
LAHLGESVDSKGEISRDKFKAALDAVGKYQKLANRSINYSDNDAAPAYQ